MLAGLATLFRGRGCDVLVTREPGGTALGNRLRAAFVDPETAIDPIAEAFVVNASRAQHVGEVIEPALRAGRLVLCDRYAAATLAYQGYGRGVDLETLLALERIATRGRTPDLTLLVDVDVATSRARVEARSRANGLAADRLEREGDGFHERVRAGYRTLAAANPRFVTLDGTLAPEELVRAAARALDAKLPA